MRSIPRVFYQWLGMFVLVWAISLSASAQTPRFPMEYYTVEDGLPDVLCYHMIQDHLGYIWIGTRQGLSRYDGYEFVSYEVPLLDSVQAASKAIYFILESQDGNLWLGTNKGLYQFDRRLEKLDFFPLSAAPKSNNPNWLVHYIFEDHKGQIWTVSGPENYLHRWNPNNQEFVPMFLADANELPVKVGNADPLSDQAPIMEDLEGRLWVGSSGQGLLQYDLEKDQFFSVRMEGKSVQSDTIYSLLWDSAQSLWLGTSKGLIHYDPVNQNLIPLPKGDPAGGESVFGLQQDQGGGIWLQQTFSLQRFDPQAGVENEFFRLPKIKLSSSLSLRKKYFVWIGADQAGNMFWVNPLNHHQFFQYDPVADSVKTFVLEFDGKPSTWGRNEEALYLTGLIDHIGLLWLGANAGLLKTKKGRANFFTRRLEIQNEGRRLFEEDPEGNVWIAGTKLWLFSPESRSLKSVNEVAPDLLKGNDLPALCLYYGWQDNLWLGKGDDYRIVLQNNRHAFVNLALGKKIQASSIQSIPIHLPEYAVDGDLKTRWSSEFSDPQSLELDLGDRKYIDRMVLYWEACYATIYEIQFSDDGQSWRTVYTTRHGQGEKESISIKQWGRYLRMVGRERSNIWCYSIWEWEVYGKNPQVEKVIPVPDKPGAYSLSMLEDQQGRHWMGLSGGGLSRYDHPSGQITHFPFEEWSEKLAPATFNVAGIYEDRNGLLWLNQSDNALSLSLGYVFLFDTESEELRLFQPQLGDSVHDRFRQVWGEDRQGFMWIFGTSGIYRYQPETKQVSYYLPRTIVSSFLEDSKGRFWVGSANEGLFLLDPLSGKAKNYGTKNDLSFNIVNSIQEDRQGRLWIGTERGLSCLYPEEERFENFTKEDGLFGNSFTSHYQDTQGRLYYGGLEGFSFFDPEKLQLDATQARMVIYELKISHQTVHPSDENPPLSQAISETKYLELNHDQNVITLGFTALHFNQPESNRYQVRMEGLDTAWVDIGTQRSMSYSGLSPGRYTFQVKGSNSDGIWTDEPTSLEITIRPPWWRSWLAYGIYVLILLIAIYAFIQWRTNSLRRQRELLRKRVFDQTQELRTAKQAAEAANEAKSTFLSTVSHELRTPLTSIIGFTKLNQKNLEEKLFPKLDPADAKTQKIAQRVSKNLDVVSSEGERLTSLINELLDLAKIESGKVDWNMVELQPVKLIERAVNATSALFTQKPSLKLITAVPNELPEITGDPDRLLQVLINLISNAVKFTEEGEVRIGVVHSPQSRVSSDVSPNQNYGLPTTDSLTFSVSDTGSGIPADQLDKVFERFQQVEDNQAGKPKGTGLGLPICKQIVEHHGGKIWVESDPDPENRDREGKGSTFFVSLPLFQPE